VDGTGRQRIAIVQMMREARPAFELMNGGDEPPGALGAGRRGAVASRIGGELFRNGSRRRDMLGLEPGARPEVRVAALDVFEFHGRVLGSRDGKTSRRDHQTPTQQ
jgi:hypothetical protein